MSADVDMRISTGVNTPTSEVDVAICPTNLCLVLAAANDAKLNTQQIFYSKDCGTTWQHSILSFPDEHFHSHPSVGWTSKQVVWLLTIATSTSGTTSLRCYNSIDFGETWKEDEVIAQQPIVSPRMWIDSNPTSPLRDTIYVIWSGLDSNGNPGVFVRSRDPNTEAWRPLIQLDSPPPPPATSGPGGCDIKSDRIGGVSAFWHDTVSKNIFVRSSTTNDLQNGPVFGPAFVIGSTIASSSLAIPSCVTHKATISISAVVETDFIYAVWADLAEATGCDNESNGSVIGVTSSCKARIWFAKSGPSGWSTPNPINLDQTLNDEFHPRLFQDPYTGTLVLVYYDTVDDPNRMMTDVWMKTSEDQGEHWSEGQEKTKLTTVPTQIGSNNYQYGDYLGLTGQNGFFFAAWTDRRSGQTEQIWARRFRIPPIPDPCTDPILTSAKITFNTANHNHDDNKDPDTDVEVLLTTIIPNEWAGFFELSGSDNFEFKRNSSHEFPIGLKGLWITWSRLQKGQIEIDIWPIGNDTWKFKFTLDFTFTNGDSVHLENPNEVVLTQDSPSTVINIDSLT